MLHRRAAPATGERRLPRDREGHGILFTLVGTVFSVRLIAGAGLGGFHLLILGAVLELTILVFEVPTGVVADTVRRWARSAARRERGRIVVAGLPRLPAAALYARSFRRSPPPPMPVEVGPPEVTGMPNPE